MALPNMLQNYLLELDGKPAGRLFGMSGGNLRADVVKTTGSQFTGNKHIGSVKVEDMSVTCGIGMSQAFYDWLSNAIGGTPTRKNGAVVALNHSQTPVYRLEFRDALIKGIGFPALNAGSKEAAYLTISISPEMTRTSTGDLGNKSGVYVSALPKGWHISDFRLKLDGLENDCSHVKTVDALKFGQKISEEEGQKLLSTADLSDLVISLPANKSAGFQQWIEDFVEKGKSGPQNEKKGVLQFLAPNLSKAYLELELVGVGPFAMEVGKLVDTKTPLPTTFRMYLNGIKLNTGPSAVM